MDVIRTVGHGTVESAAFCELLRGAGIEAVVDVRRYPGSRHNPQFGREAMSAWLDAAGFAYEWVEDLGGRRHASPESPNTVLRNPQFRAYADHMASREFAAGIGRLLETARTAPVVVMCSESVWWRCHRRLIADHLVLVEGRGVRHLFHDGRLTPHPPTKGARSDGTHVVYDGIVPAPGGG